MEYEKRLVNSAARQWEKRERDEKKTRCINVKPEFNIKCECKRELMW